LVHITHDQHGRSVRERLEHRLHEKNIDHEGFVDDQQIAVGRVVVVALEPSPLRLGLQKPVDGPSKPVASVIRLTARSAGVQSLTPLADRMRSSMAAPLRG
jgi:hypothetical protein